MNNEPIKMEDILIPGAKLSGEAIDPKNPFVKKILRAAERQQQALEKLKAIDWEKLSRTYITI